MKKLIKHDYVADIIFIILGLLLILFAYALILFAYAH